MADGSLEISVGCAFFLAGLVTLVGQLSFPTAPDWGWGLQLLAWLLLAREVGSRWKRSRPEPDPGYVEPFTRRGAAVFGLALAGLFFGVLVLLDRVAPETGSGFVLLLGTTFGIGDGVTGGLARSPRAIVRGAGSIVLAWWLAFRGITLDLTIYMAAMGVLFVVSGFLARRRYGAHRESRA